MSQPKNSGLPLHHKITLGMILGLALGLALNHFLDSDSSALKECLWWLDLLGKDLFVGMLKMLIAPLIFASIVAGITTLPQSKELGAIGFKTVGFYVMTTTIAVSIGLMAVLLLQPGKQESSQVLRESREAQLATYREEFSQKRGGVDPLSEEHKLDYLDFVAQKDGDTLSGGAQSSKWRRIQGTEDLSAGDMFRRDILKPILSNPFKALAEGNTLGIICFAILTGLACQLVGSGAQPVRDFFQGLNRVVMKVTLWVMELAPYSIGCLIASLVAKLGIEALKPLAWYCGTVIFGIAIHMGILLLLVRVLGKMSPLEFFKGIRSAWMVAFTTTSSAATLPVTMECVNDNLKVSPKVSGFSLPVGATINMDGTALYEGVAVIFMLQVYGGLDDVPIVLAAAKVFIIFITAVLASVGAAAVPSAGLVTMAIVAGAIGLPLHYIAYLFVVDHLLDMFRTSTNITGDAAATVVVNHWERNRLGNSS